MRLAAMVLGCAIWVSANPAAQTSSHGYAGVIAGTLTSVDLDRPVRRATVTLSTSQPASRRTVTTDAEGRFTFDALPPGDYSLSASKAGFLEMVFGARRPGRSAAGTLIHLAAGQRVDRLAMQLPRGGVISGIVTDEFGDPALGVPVRAMRLGYDNGARMAQPAAIATTDDLGGYRLPALLPGEYVVSAVPRDAVAAVASTQESARQRMAQIAASGRTAPVNADAATPPDAVGYVPVYFGGTTSPSAATRVTVGVSQQVGGIDLQLQSIQTSTIKGVIANADGTAVSANVQLIDPAMPIANLGVWFRNSTPGGKFSFAGLAPGTYVVQARASSGGTTVTGSLTVPVDGDVADVALTLRRGVTVSGTIDRATLKPPVDLRRVRVGLHPLTTASEWEREKYEAAPDMEGRFVLRNVAPGTYRVAAAGLPQGWWLDSASFDSRNAADVHLQVAHEQIAGGVLTLTSRTADLTGAVTAPDGSPVQRSVMLFPSERMHWVAQSRRIHVVQAVHDGRYAIRNLLPGEYLLVTLDGVEPGEQFDPEFLQRVAPDARRVTLDAGIPAVANLHVR